MISRLTGFPVKAEKTVNIRRGITALASLLALGTLFVGTQADARQVQFRSVGGRWSHSYHSGWHRYWGGPSIGFYYAPSPVYVVPGYSSASYYSGPDFWYSNPSFGLNLNLGGNGHYYGGHHYRNRPVIQRERRWRDNGHSRPRR
ncbi:MAG: hypothetical protein JWN14_2326 [Chthonomonadales bacterium]|nr:hypothetical protein [Chthonomonadales bacterium]